MAAIKTMAVVDQANQLGRVLPPEAFYNELIRFRSCCPLHWRWCPPMAPDTSPYSTCTMCSHITPPVTKGGQSQALLKQLWSEPTCGTPLALSGSLLHSRLVSVQSGHLDQPLCAPLRSEKLDVDDHYIAWRQSHDSPGTEYIDGEGPFSFCSYPFLLNPRAKSKLLHTEAKFMMNHTVQQVRSRATHQIASPPSKFPCISASMGRAL